MTNTYIYRDSLLKYFKFFNHIRLLATITVVQDDSSSCIYNGNFIVIVKYFITPSCYVGETCSFFTRNVLKNNLHRCQCVSSVGNPNGESLCLLLSSELRNIIAAALRFFASDSST